MKQNVFSYKRADLLERTVQFSKNIIVLCRKVRSDFAGRMIGQQLFRSATSIGANLHEAQGAQSRNDFIAKISITQKEAIETVYWLRLLKEELEVEMSHDLLDEANQLAKIFSSILITSNK